uniref:TIDP3357 n=1 Tax=Arundo donax TaxID=35708 RepID=A0A0A9EIF7_ARUDO
MATSVSTTPAGASRPARRLWRSQLKRGCPIGLPTTMQSLMCAGSRRDPKY